MSEKNPMALVAINMAELEKALVEGETFELVEARLKAIAQNVDLVYGLMGRSEVNAEYFKNQAAKYTAMARYWEKTERYLNQMIKSDMEAHRVTDLLGTNVRFKLSYGKDKMIIDQSKLPSKYIMHVPEPDKKQIEEALANGFEVAGVTVEKSPRLTPYIIKKVES